MNLHGRYAIITGAGQGLGACIAEHYAKAGASLLLCSRTYSDLETIKNKLTPYLTPAQQLLIQTTNVADPQDVNHLIATATSQFPKIDILINNAGIYGPMGAIDEIEWDEWVDTIQINLMGAVYLSRTILPHFKKNNYGKIINLSGGGATNPLPKISAYAASKAALVRFMETLALEVKQFNIDVNAIAPGALATRLTDQLITAGPDKVGEDFYKRMLKLRDDGGTPLEHGANLAVYLGSAASDGITGKLISAVWDPWQDLQNHRKDLDESDIYTLRRITPKDRNKSWGDK